VVVSSRREVRVCGNLRNLNDEFYDTGGEVVFVILAALDSDLWVNKTMTTSHKELIRDSARSTTHNNALDNKKTLLFLRSLDALDRFAFNVIIENSDFAQHIFDLNDEYQEYMLKRIKRVFEELNIEKQFNTIEKIDEVQALVAQLDKVTVSKVEECSTAADCIAGNRFVKVDKLLILLRKNQRSVQHKVLSYVRKTINDNWVDTWELNTNADMRSLARFYRDLDIRCNISNVPKETRRFKYYKNSRREKGNKRFFDFEADVEPQMKRVTKQIVSAVASNEKVSETTSKIDSSAEAITSAAEQISSRVRRLEETLTRTSQGLLTSANLASATLCNGTTKISENLAKTTGRINVAADMFGELMGKVNELVTSTTTSIQAITGKIQGAISLFEALAFVGKLAASGYLLHQLHSYGALNAGSIASLIIMLIPAGAGNMAMKILPYLQRAITGSINLFYRFIGKGEENSDSEQDDEPLEETVDEIQLEENDFIEPQIETNGDTHYSAFENMFRAIWYTLKSVFTPPSENEYLTKARMTSRLKIAADSIRNAKTLYEFLTSVIGKAVEIASDFLLTRFGYIPFFMEKDRFSPLVEQYYNFRSKSYEKSAITNSTQAMEIKKFHEELLDFEQYNALHASKTKSAITVMPYLRTMITWTENLLKYIPDHLLGDESRKLAPFWLYIHGPPRIGKSYFFQPYIVNELARVLKLSSQFENPHHLSFFRNPNDQYWDQYNGQPIVQYNDLFQACFDDEKTATIMEELTNVVDDSPLSLVMAFEGKGKTFFKSQLVVTNAQDDIVGQPFIKSWSGGLHLCARRNIVVRLDINVKYMSTAGVIDQVLVKNAMANDPCITSAKGTPLVPADMYTLTFSNPINAEVYAITDFYTGVEYIKRVAMNRFGLQTEFRDKLAKVMAENWEGTPPPIPASHTFITGALPQMDHVHDKPTTCNAKQEFLNSYTCMCATDIMTIFHFFGNDAFSGNVAKMISDEHNKGCKSPDEWSKFIGNIYGVDYFTMRDVDTSTTYRVSSSSIKQQRERSIKNSIMDNVKKLGQALHEEIKSFFEQDPKIIALKMFKVGAALVLSVLAKIAIRKVVNKAISKFKDWRAHRKEKNGDIELEGEHRELMKILNKRKNLKPQSHEHKHSAKRIIIRKSNQVNPQIYTMNNADLENVVKCNMARLFCLVNGEKLSIGGNVLCIGGDVFVSPRHYWHIFKQYYQQCKELSISFELRMIWTSGLITPIPWDSLLWYEPEYQHTGDITYFRVKKMMAHRDIRKFFRPVSQDISTYGSYLFGLRSEKTDTNGKPTTALLDIGQPVIRSVRYQTTPEGETPMGIPYKKEFVEIEQIWTYDNSMTHTGDCGMLLIHTDETVPAKIYGMHVAGIVSKRYGFSCPIYREDIDEAREYFMTQSEEKVIPMLEFGSRYIAYDKVPQSRVFSDLKDAKIEVLGTLQRENGQRLTLTSPRKNKVSPSVVFDAMEHDFGPTKYGPSALSPFIDDKGNMIRPYSQALSKLCNYTSMIDQQREDKVVQHIVDTMEEWKSPVERRLLSDFEAVNGNLWMNPVDMSTSPGFPYVSMRTGGKLPWFDCSIDSNGRKVYTPGEFVQAEVNDRVEKARQGICKETYFIATLKDELRPLAKVMEGKTRLFQNGPVDLTIAFRKYFGAWIEHGHYQGTTREMFQGADPNSYDWTMIFRYMDEVKGKIRAGDYKNYDSTASFQSGMSYAKAANAWYRDSEENQRIRYVLMATCVFSTQIVEDIIILFRQGNPSGFRATTHFNDFNNMRYHRHAFLEFTPFNMSTYYLHNRSKFCGDDNLVKWSNEALKYITPEKWVRWLASIGVTYTTADKQDGELLVDTAIEDATFVKRSFVKHPIYNVICAPLDFDVIDNIARWSESNPANMEDQMQRFNAALLELSNYSKHIFSRYRERFVEYCGMLVASGYSISASRLLHYDDCERMKWPHLFEITTWQRLDPHLTSQETLQSVRPTEDALYCSSQGALGDQGKNQVEFAGTIVINPASYELTGNSLKLIKPQSHEVKHTGKRTIARARPQIDHEYLESVRDYVEEYKRKYGDSPFAPMNIFSTQEDTPKPQMDLCFENGTTHFYNMTTTMATHNATSSAQKLAVGLVTLGVCFVALSVPAIITIVEHLRFRKLRVRSVNKSSVETSYEPPTVPLFPDENNNPDVIEPQMETDKNEQTDTSSFDDSEATPSERRCSNTDCYCSSTTGVRFALMMASIRKLIAYIIHWNSRFDLCEDHLPCMELGILTGEMEEIFELVTKSTPFTHVSFDEDYNEQILEKTLSFSCCEGGAYDILARAIMMCEFISDMAKLTLKRPFCTLNGLHCSEQTRMRFRAAKVRARILVILERIKKIKSTQCQRTNEDTQRSFRNRCRDLTIQPQMDVPGGAPTSVSEEEITTFIDKNETHDVDTHKGSRVARIGYPRVDIESLVCRPYEVLSVSWRPTQAMGTQVFNFTLPNAIVPKIKAYIERAVYWQPSFEVEFRLNAAPQHYGTILINPLPDPSTLDPNYWSLNGAATGTWSKLRAGANQVLTMSLPWISLYDKMRTNTTNAAFETWEVRGYVLSPLTTISTPQNVTITVYCRVTDPRLEGYQSRAISPMPQMEMPEDDDYFPKTKNSLRITGGSSHMERPVRPAMPAVHKRILQMAKSREENEVKTASGSISKALGIAGTIGLAASPIPSIGWILGGIGGLLKAGSHVASFFGYSAGRNLSYTSPVVRRSAITCKVSDTALSMSSSPFDANVGINHSLANSSINDMGILHYIQRPCVVQAGKIMTTDLPGKLLLSRPLLPGFVSLSGSRTFTHAGFVCSLFGQWRGSMCYNLSFVCTPFHSCRVRICFNPANNNVVTPDDLVGVVLDITKDTEYNFSIPFISTTPVKITPINVMAGYGFLQVYLLNTVVDGGSGSAPIYYELTEIPGADFQFFDYRPNTNAFYNNVAPADRAPAASAKEVETEVIYENEIEAQMDVETGMCELPSSSYSCLQKQHFPPLGNIESGCNISLVTSPDEYVSFKQLFNLLAPIYFMDSNGQAVVESTLPKDLTFGNSLRGPRLASTTCLNLWNPTLRLSRLFRYWRGSLRFAIHYKEQPKWVRVFSQPLRNFDVVTTRYTVEPSASPQSFDTIAAPLYHIESLSDKYVDFQTTWRCPTKCRVTYNYTLTEPTADGWTITDNFFVGTDAEYRGTIYCSGGDDFTCGYQMPQLPSSQSTLSPRKTS